VTNTVRRPSWGDDDAAAEGFEVLRVVLTLAERKVASRPAQAIS
jgi:hypothetical protein